VDEVDEVGNQLGVRHRRAEHPLVALSGDALRGAANDDLRRLRLPAHLRRGKACRTGDAADVDENLIPRNQALDRIDRFLGLTAVVGIEWFDLLTTDTAGGVLFLDHETDRVFLAAAHGRSIAAEGTKHADLDGIGERRLA
jgi:hypothetical protein